MAGKSQSGLRYLLFVKIANITNNAKAEVVWPDGKLCACASSMP